MASQSDTGSGTVSRGVSLNFEAVNLVYDDEAEYQREEQQQQNEVRIASNNQANKMIMDK